MLPEDDKDFDTWQSHFLLGFKKYGEELGFKSNEIQQVEDLIDEHKKGYVSMLIKKAEYEQALEKNEKRKEEVADRLIRIIDRIKEHEDYTQQIGEEMGLDADADIRTMLLLQPKLNIIKNHTSVEIHFDNESTDGIIIYSRRGNERKYRILGVETSSPYHDTRQKINPEVSEQRFYYAYYIVCGFFTSRKSKVEKITI